MLIDINIRLMFEDPRSKYELSELLVAPARNSGKERAGCCDVTYHRKAATHSKEEDHARFQPYQ